MTLNWAGKYEAQFGIKSGLTPIEYLFPSLIPARDRVERKEIEEWQKQQLLGFTRELAQLSCLCTRELKNANLGHFIIPLLQKDNWESVPAQPEFTRSHLYPLKTGIVYSDSPGYWTAHNARCGDHAANRETDITHFDVDASTPMGRIYLVDRRCLLTKRSSMR